MHDAILTALAFHLLATLTLIGSTAIDGLRPARGVPLRNILFDASARPANIASEDRTVDPNPGDYAKAA